MHISSTEPKRLKQLGHASQLPEKYGVDFLWWRQQPGLKRGWCGVQRKEAKDLIASIRDGRLARELVQMEPLLHSMVVVEGRFDRIGELVAAGRSEIPVMLWDAALWALQDRGVKIGYTVNIDETARMIERFKRWTDKSEHSALKKTRNGPPTSTWGKGSNLEYQVHLLTGLPGVGDKLARSIISRFGGVPWRWTINEKQLAEVPGISRDRAKKLIEVLQGMEKPERLDSGG